MRSTTRSSSADSDPYKLFDQMGVSSPSHAFYLGCEMMKARTALTLDKSYRQDQALSWGFLTVPEASHMERASAAAGRSPARWVRRCPTRSRKSTNRAPAQARRRGDSRGDRDQPGPG